MILPIDKQIHFLWGICLALLLAPHWFLVIASVLVVGIGKELYDHLSGKGSPEIMDAVAVFAGGVVGSVLHVLVSVL